MSRILRLLPTLLLLALAASVCRADDPPVLPGPPPDEQVLKTAKIKADGPGLLEFLRKRVPTEAQQKRVAELLPLLADERFAVRQKASADLAAVGPGALPQLRRALHHEDVEVRERAGEVMGTIEGTAGATAAAAAVRLLRQRRPAGAVAVLLDYLPAADDEAVEEEAVATLLVLGVADGKVDPALVAALQDQAPERRAAAALVVGRYGSEDQRTAVRKLLTDADVRVRFRAAQALLAARDKSAVPVLAAVLSEGPPAQATQAHDLLECMAGSNAPRTTLGDSDPVRRRCRDAWEAWWKVYGPRLDLAKADVDLPANNPALQTRVAARRFLEAIMTGDSAGFVKATDAPFTLLDVQTFATRNEVDNYFLNTLVPGRQKGAISFKRVQSAEEYATHAAAEHKDLLKGLTKPEVRAVTAQAVIDGQPQNVVVFVRLANGQAHVVGCGQDKSGAPRPPGM